MDDRQQHTPGQPEGTPGQPEGTPGQPQGTPGQPQGTPGQPQGTPGQPEDWAGAPQPIPSPDPYPPAAAGGAPTPTGAWSSQQPTTPMPGYNPPGYNPPGWAPPQAPPPGTYVGGPGPVGTAPWAPAKRRRVARPSAPVLIGAIALAAALIGGGIGGAVGYNAASESAGSGFGSLPVPVTSSKSEAPVGSVQQVAAKVLPSVVSIEVRSAGRSPLGGGGLSGSGSGIVISKDGLILTNAHVVSEGELAVAFAAGKSTRAKLIAADPQTDLAVIKAEGVQDALPITFGKSSDLTVGQPVVAIGSPLGLSGTVTQGIVSSLQRPLLPQSQRGGGGENTVIDGIQTDAPINPGNSGGALVDLNGNLVGITSAIASIGGGVLGGQAGSIGLGFAIPIDQARIIAEKLARGETVAHALIGVQVSSSDNPTQRGALIQRVTDSGPAGKAGLKRGDLVIKLDDRLIETSDGLVAGVRSRQPGEKAVLTYLRDGETRTAEVTLGSDQDQGLT